MGSVSRGLRRTKRLSDTERQLRYQATPIGRARRLLRSATRSSSKRGHPPPELSVEDLVPALERGVCAVTGLSFVWRTAGNYHPLSPSIDRPDSSKPYSKDNFRIVCWAVNAGCGSWGQNIYLAIAARALGVPFSSTSGTDPLTKLTPEATPQ